MSHSSTIKKFVKARRILPLCLCTVAAIALFTAVPASAQSNDVLNRIKRIENEVDTLNRAVYKGETPPPIAGGGANEGMDARLSQIETDLRNLTGKVEQQAYDNQQLQQKLDALQQDSQMRLDAIEAQLRGQPPMGAAQPPMNQPQGGLAPGDMGQPTLGDNPEVLQPDTMTQPAGDVTGAETGAGATDAAGLYEQGFGEIKRSDYPAAEKTFIAFMKEYPTHALAPNALYWLGETYYVRKEYDKAARVFAEAYQKYPGGPKGADNLLKLGMSLAGKGEKANACIALGQLKKEYPKGPAPVLAKGDSEMMALGCKA